jgi:hypothetical protein
MTKQLRRFCLLDDETYKRESPKLIADVILNKNNNNNNNNKPVSLVVPTSKKSRLASYTIYHVPSRPSSRTTLGCRTITTTPGYHTHPS